MPMDEQHDDGLGGRSRDRREVTEANRWARPLCALGPVELAAAPIPDEVRAAVRAGWTTREGRALNRQHQRIDKLVRSLDPEEIARLDAFLADPGAIDRAVDRCCDRLVSDGDPALDALIVANPDLDRQRLRTLV